MCLKMHLIDKMYGFFIFVFAFIDFASFKRFPSDCHPRASARHQPIHYHHKSVGRANQAKTQVKTIEKFYHQIRRQPAIERNEAEHGKSRNIIRNRTFWSHLKCIVAAIWAIKSATMRIYGRQRTEEVTQV